MKIRVEQGLAYVEAVLTFRRRSLRIVNTILDTGSASTIFSADRLLEIGVVPEPSDALRRLRGVGGTEYAFTKSLDLLAMDEMKVLDFEIEVGAMDYGFPADGILGLDYLLRIGALIDLRRLELRGSISQ
ncbi:MAG TPA: aspartyl protease family protein [Thermoanaerobaculia bacterium]|nr:aspartyl protease family protein [Thermoanaerobaculia bacterium]